MAYQLGVDTSLSEASLTLFKNQEVIASQSWLKEKSHSEIITDTFNELLEKSSLKTTDIDHIYCVNGPGSFTGIRVGLNFAKTIAYSLNIQLTAINRLQLQVAGIDSKENSQVLSTIDAQKNSVFVSLYKASGSSFSSVFENKVLPIGELASVVTEKTMVVGEGLNNYMTFIEDKTLSLLSFEGEKSYGLDKIFNSPVNAKDITPLKWHEFQPLYIKASAPEEKLNPTTFQS